MTIDRVSVSWNEQWDLERYLARYVATRRLAGENTLSSLQACLARYPGQAPFRKSDLDYFLDANYARAAR